MNSFGVWDGESPRIMLISADEKKLLRSEYLVLRKRRRSKKEISGRVSPVGFLFTIGLYFRYRFLFRPKILTFRFLEFFQR